MFAPLKGALSGEAAGRPRAAAHETFVSHRTVRKGSDRSFGVIFAVLFVVIGLWPLWSGNTPRLWALGIAGLFLLLAWLRPTLLKPLNNVWLLLGLLLHRVVTPLVMGVMYYGTIVPVGLLLKAFGKDLLRQKQQPAAETYWIRREPPGPEHGSMSRQF